MKLLCWFLGLVRREQRQADNEHVERVEGVRSAGQRATRDLGARVSRIAPFGRLQVRLQGLHQFAQVSCLLHVRVESGNERNRSGFIFIRLRETIGRKIMKGLKREDDAVTYAAIEFLNALMQVRPICPFIRSFNKMK